MRYANMILCLLMLLFIGVQYNDPDGPVWMLIYAVPAVWAGLAAARPRWLTGRMAQALLIACIVASLLGIVRFWPDTPRWWAKDVWYDVETAREGMGMMIVLLVLLVVGWSIRTARRRHAGAGGRDAAGPPNAGQRPL